MASRQPGTWPPLTRRAILLLALGFVTSALGAVAVLMGYISLPDWRRSQAFMAIGMLCFTLTGSLTFTAVIKDPRPFWFGIPRIAWLVIGLGIFAALTSAAFAFVPAPG